MAPNLQKFLDRLTSRSVLTDEQQDAVLDLPFTAKQVAAGCDFIAIDEKVHHSCYILEGLVGRFDQNSKGARQITALHIAGDMSDLHSLVQPTATSALQALSTSTILHIPHSALRRLTCAYPAVAEAFWRDTMVDSMILAQWVVNVGRREAPSRIAHLLCEMACRYKVDLQDDGLQFKLCMTQAQLGDATSMTPVHVSRTLKKLAEVGTSIRHGIVRIESWSALAELGDFDRDYLQEGAGPLKSLCLV